MSINVDEQRELNLLIDNCVKSKDVPKLPRFPRFGQGESPVAEDEKNNFGKMSQWTSSDGIRFFPAGHTVPQLQSGVFEIKYCNNRGHYWEQIPVKTEGLLRFPDGNSEKVIQEIQNFWEREQLFHDFGLAYKRGIILWGPPGSGKSSTIQIIIADVIERGGVVFKFNIMPSLFLEGVRIFREIQPETKIVILMEDIDSILDDYGESDVLNILDGVDRIEKVVFIATTNYPELLGDRIINRPSRFDKRFKMPHPNSKSRKLYFEHLFKQHESIKNVYNINKWVKDTDNMSIAHLKELFVAVCILGEKYEDAISVLQAMVEDKLTSSEVKVGF